MTWWDHASVEQRLAQINGGIECGLTARQIGLCVGARPSQVHAVAINGGLHIPRGQHPGARRSKQMGELKRAYWQGEREINRAPTVSARVIDDDFDEAAA